MKDTSKIVVAAVGIAAAAGVAVYAITQVTGPVGGSCSQAGTPCNTAISPYEQEFLKCSNLYFADLNEFIAEDAVNGTGLTVAQKDDLAYLKTCMDTAAANIAKTAHQYAPTQTMPLLVSFIGGAVLIGAAAVGVSSIIKTLRTTPNSGASAANMANNSVMQGNVDNGIITPEQASSLTDDLTTMTTEDLSSFEDFTSLLVDADIITEETASALVTAAEAAMAEDEAVTDAALEGA